MIKISVKYAFLSSVFLMIGFHLSIVFNVNPITDFRQLVVNVVLFGLFLFFSMKEFKSKNGDVLHFWQGMTIGFNTYFLSTLLFAAYAAILFNLDQELISNYQESALKILEDGKVLYQDRLGEDGYEESLKQIRDTEAVDLVIRSGLQKIVAGFFITPVISIILRKQQN